MFTGNTKAREPMRSAMALRPVLLLIVLLVQGLCMAQDDLTAYEPPIDDTYTMDDEEIGFTGRTAEGRVGLDLPEGTYRIDLLNSRGRKVREYQGEEMMTLDTRELKAGTYMMRAYVPGHIHRKRIVLMRPGASLWTIDADTP